MGVNQVGYIDKSRIIFPLPRQALGKDLSRENFAMCSVSDPNKISGKVEVTDIGVRTISLTWTIDKTFLQEDGTAEDFELRCSSMGMDSSALWKSTKSGQMESIEDAINQCSAYADAAAISEQKAYEHTQGIKASNLEIYVEGLEATNLQDALAEIIARGGSTGQNGKSAYEIAVENGFKGTVEEWLISLKGKDGLTTSVNHIQQMNGDVTVSAKNIPIESINGMVASNVQDAIAANFQSVVDGKKLVETAITDKGGTVSKAGTTATFEELKNGVDTIKIGAGVNETLPPMVNKLTCRVENGGLEILFEIPESPAYAGAIVVWNAVHTPVGVSDGEKIDVGMEKSVKITGLENGTTYYIRVFPYNDKGQYQTVLEGSTVEAIPISYLRLGIRWAANSPDPDGEYMYDCTGFAAEVATDLTSEVRNDFDNVYPFNQIEQVILPTGDVMQKIPKFYVKHFFEDESIDGETGYEGYIISDVRIDETYHLHDAFRKYNGEGYGDYVYISSYETSSNNKSVPSATPTVNQKKSDFRTNARAKGAGWSQLEFTTWDLQQLLITLVLGTRDSSKYLLGRPHSAMQPTGLTKGAKSTVVQLDTRGCSFYGIENPFGNCFKWLDGLIFEWDNGNVKIYACYNISQYDDTQLANHTLIGYTTKPIVGYISKLGYDAENPCIRIPIESVPEKSYYCGTASLPNSGSSWRPCYVGFSGGSSTPRSHLYHWDCANNILTATSVIGSRLILKPTE